jgi:hypothetical protein
MNLEKIVAVSGLPGLYRMTANRANGLIVEELDSGKTKFVSARRHQVTPLESIGIFTDDGETADLKEVFKAMLDNMEEHPPVAHTARAEELHEYFASVLPNYDRDNVYTSDIKKVVKWFGILNQHDMLSLDDDSPADEEE